MMTQSNLMVMHEDQIPEGYKKTEIGLFPKEWNIISLGELSIISRLAGAEYTTMWVEDDKGEIIALRGFNIGKNTINLRDVVRITSKLSKKLIRSKLCEYDVVYPCVGTIGNAAVIYENDKYHIQQNIARITPKRGRLNSEYLASYLISELAHKEVARFNATSSQPNVLVSSLRQYRVPCPNTLEEQEKIAKVLSDTDVFITELEKLIEKKQAIKTATMQQLLTGKTRLPEFALRADGTPKGYKETELGKIPEDWEIYRLSDVSLIDPENLNSSTSHDYQFEYISLENVDRGILLGTTSQIFSTSPSRARRVVRCGDILISTVRPNLMSHYYFNKPQRDVVCSTGFSLARPIESKLNGLFFYYHLFGKIINNQIDKIVIGSNYPAINSNDVRNFKVMLPSLKEQHSIVKIFEQLDSEIAKRTMQLKKLQFIKQGLMQELLTGKTRLV